MYSPEMNSEINRILELIDHKQDWKSIITNTNERNRKDSTVKDNTDQLIDL